MNLLKLYWPARENKETGSNKCCRFDFFRDFKKIKEGQPGSDRPGRPYPLRGYARAAGTAAHLEAAGRKNAKKYFFQKIKKRGNAEAQKTEKVGYFVLFFGCYNDSVKKQREAKSGTLFFVPQNTSRRE